MMPASTSVAYVELSDDVQEYNTDSPIDATASIVFSDNVSQPGTVDFYVDGNLVGSEQLGKGGSVTISLPGDIARGTHEVTAIFTLDNAERTTQSTCVGAELTVPLEEVIPGFQR